MVKTLLLVVLFFVSGCTLQQATAEDIMGQPANIEQWGQRAVILASQLNEGQENVVLTFDGVLDGAQQAPSVRTMYLTCNPNGTPANTNIILRWAITPGVGGGSGKFYVDALGTQQLSLPFGKVTIALVAQKLLLDDAFGGTDVSYTVNAFIGDGNTSTKQAQFTEAILLANGTDETLDIPIGANGFRVVGLPTAFDALMLYQFAMGDGVFARFTGDLLKATAYTESFIPIPGASKNLVVTNGTASPVRLAIQWGLDF